MTWIFLIPLTPDNFTFFTTWSLWNIRSQYETLKNYTSENLAQCFLQKEPARKLVNLSKVNILILTAESSYHAPYDHGTSNFLKQAGVDHDFIRLEDHDIKGNGHMMMHEKNSREVSNFINNWIEKNYVW